MAGWNNNKFNKERFYFTEVLPTAFTEIIFLKYDRNNFKNKYFHNVFKLRIKLLI